METAGVSTWEAQALTIERNQLRSVSLGPFVGRKRKGQFRKARFLSFSWAVSGASPQLCPQYPAFFPPPTPKGERGGFSTGAVETRTAPAATATRGEPPESRIL